MKNKTNRILLDEIPKRFFLSMDRLLWIFRITVREHFNVKICTLHDLGLLN